MSSSEFGDTDDDGGDVDENAYSPFQHAPCCRSRCNVKHGTDFDGYQDDLRTFAFCPRLKQNEMAEAVNRPNAQAPASDLAYRARLCKCTTDRLMWSPNRMLRPSSP